MGGFLPFDSMAEILASPEPANGDTIARLRDDVLERAREVEDDGTTARQLHAPTRLTRRRSSSLGVIPEPSRRRSAIASPARAALRSTLRRLLLRRARLRHGSSQLGVDVSVGDLVGRGEAQSDRSGSA